MAISSIQWTLKWYEDWDVITSEDIDEPQAVAVSPQKNDTKYVSHENAHKIELAPCQLLRGQS